MAIKNTRRQIAYGYPNPQSGIFPEPFVVNRPPATTDHGVVGQYWIDISTDTIWFLVSFSNGGANWVQVETGGGAGVFSSLTVTPGPISLTGTTTINTTGAATTTIGTGGTGSVAIGNATGNTAITGQLTTSGNFFTINGVVSAGSTTSGATSTNLQILKSRAGGVITTGDTLGNLIFAGFDGTSYTTGASITSTSSGTIAATRVASDLKFNTHPDAALGAPILRMTIAPAGNITIATPDAGTALSVSGATTAISATAGDITIGAGDLNINTPGQGINLPGPIQIITGAGVPANPLALQAGDMYINTTPTGATDRIFVATGVGAWTNVTCAA